MGQVINFTGVTRLDIPPDRMLEAAIGQLDKVVILGYDKDGEEYIASSAADGGTVLWLMERCKKRIMEVGEE